MQGIRAKGVLEESQTDINGFSGINDGGSHFKEIMMLRTRDLFRIIRLVLLLTAGFTATACSTKPIPKTFSDIDTFEIAQAIRCELREAFDTLRGNQELRTVTTVNVPISTGVEPCCGQKPKVVKQMVTIDPMLHTSVQYEFTFDVKENNDFSGNLDFVDIMTAGMFSLGLKAENKRERKNLRNFRIKESALSLLSPGMEAACFNVKRGTGFQYPINGKVDIKESLETFLKLYKTGKLSGDKGPTFGDTLQFTTTLGGSVAPGIDLTRTPTNVTLDKTGINLSLLRTDQHKLAVVFVINAGAIAQATYNARQDPKRDEQYSAQQQGLRANGALEAVLPDAQILTAEEIEAATADDLNEAGDRQNAVEFRLDSVITVQ